jgi:MurNAc alpha-1-phosphate uridylyltransferase
VINVSYLADQITASLGDGSRFGARIAYSHEAEPMESAGGIAQALHLLGEGPTLIVAADIFTDFDYASLAPARRLVADAGIDPTGASPLAHLVLVPNREFRPEGDYSLLRATDESPYGRVGVGGSPRWTWTGIGIFPLQASCARFRLARKSRSCRSFIDWMGRGLVSGGSSYSGTWENLGTPEQLHQLDVKLSPGKSQRESAVDLPPPRKEIPAR